MSGGLVIALAVAGFAPQVMTFGVGSGTITIPSGSSQLILEAWPGSEGGAGGTPFSPGPPPSGPNFGPGGTSGSYGPKTLAIVAADWGKTFTYVCGAAGVAGGDGALSSITNGTYTHATTMVVHGSTSGTPGAATGCDSSTPGNAGGTPSGGAGIVGITGTTGPRGGMGQITGTPSNGFNGIIQASFS